MNNSYIEELNDLIADINEEEIKAHLDTPEGLKNWCYSWRTAAAQCSLGLYVQLIVLEGGKEKVNKCEDLIDRKELSAKILHAMEINKANKNFKANEGLSIAQGYIIDMKKIKPSKTNAQINFEEIETNILHMMRDKEYYEMFADTLDDGDDKRMARAIIRMINQCTQKEKKNESI